MSLAFSDTTNKNGIVQHIERELGFNDGEISGNTTRLAHFTSDVNLAVDEVTAIQNMVGGTWNADDLNHTKYPIIDADLVSGQQDYTFTDDSDGNLILDILKVQVKTATTNYQTITPKDRQSSGTDGDIYSDGSTGTPLYYDKTANGLFFWPTPDASVTDGVRMFVNREGSYFLVSDTTKNPGFYGLFHYFCVLSPAEKYARINQLSTHTDLLNQKLMMKNDIQDHYARRARDEKPRLAANVESTR